MAGGLTENATSQELSFGARDMRDHTWLLCVVGMMVFGVGGFARQYMVVRLYGWKGYLSSQRELTDKYRALVRGEGAPSWPLVMSPLCIALGIIIIFGAILWPR